MIQDETNMLGGMAFTGLAFATQLRRARGWVEHRAAGLRRAADGGSKHSDQRKPNPRNKKGRLDRGKTYCLPVRP